MNIGCISLRRTNNCTKLSYLLIVSLLFFLQTVSAVDQFNYRGCYSFDDVSSYLTENDYYQYQSVSYCEEQCGSSAVAALFDGGTCYCGDSTSFLNGLSVVSDSECSTACTGWPYQNCGGSSAMNVYVNVNAESSSQTSISRTSSASSTSKTSSQGSSTGSASSSSSSTSTSTSTSASTSQSSSSSSRSSNSISSVSTSVFTQYTTNVIIQSVITTSNRANTTILVTTTSIVAVSTESASLGSQTNRSNSGKNKLSGGAIAGIVIGVVFGVLIVLLLIILAYTWHRRNNRSNNDSDLDLTENKQYQPYSFGVEDVPPVVVPPTNTVNKSASKYNASTKVWMLGNKTTKASSSSDSSQTNNQSTNLLNEEPVPTTIIDENKTHSNTLDPRSNLTSEKLLTHTNTFEDPVTIYESDNIFSATSLQDIGNDDNKLRIVNPDELDDSFSADGYRNSDDIHEK